MTRSATWQTFWRRNQLNPPMQVRGIRHTRAIRLTSDGSCTMNDGHSWISASLNDNLKLNRGREGLFSNLKGIRCHSIDDSWIPNFGTAALRKPKLQYQRNISSIQDKQSRQTKEIQISECWSSGRKSLMTSFGRFVSDSEMRRPREARVKWTWRCESIMRWPGVVGELAMRERTNPKPEGRLYLEFLFGWLGENS
jgi:hypothetical protein